MHGWILERDINRPKCPFGPHYIVYNPFPDLRVLSPCPEINGHRATRGWHAHAIIVQCIYNGGW